MIDQWGRQVNYMRVSVTDRCNFRCVYCMPLEGVELKPREEYLSFDELMEVVETGVELGIDRIRLTGGEPTIRAGLADLCARIKAAGVKDLSMTTNGLMFPKMAADLKRAGLDRVNISLDTFRSDRLRRIARIVDDVTPILASIDVALALEMHPVKVNMVVMRGWNDDELIDMARLSLDRPIHVRFIEVMPFSEAHEYSPEVLVPAAEIRERLMAEFEDIEPLREGVPGNGPAKYWRIPGAQGTIGLISAVTECFCGGCNRVRVSADGRMNPCLGHIMETDLKPVLRNPAGHTRAELRAMMEEVIRDKPREHNFDDWDSDFKLRVMHAIGG